MNSRFDRLIKIAALVICGCMFLVAAGAVLCGYWWHVITLIATLAIGGIIYVDLCNEATDDVYKSVN